MAATDDRVPTIESRPDRTQPNPPPSRSRQRALPGAEHSYEPAHASIAAGERFPQPLHIGLQPALLELDDQAGEAVQLGVLDCRRREGVAGEALRQLLMPTPTRDIMRIDELDGPRWVQSLDQEEFEDELLPPSLRNV